MSLNFVAEKQAWPLFFPCGTCLVKQFSPYDYSQNQNKTPEEIILIASLIFFSPIV